MFIQLQHCKIDHLQGAWIIFFLTRTDTHTTHAHARGDRTRDISYWKVFTYGYPPLEYPRRNLEGGRLIAEKSEYNSFEKKKISFFIYNYVIILNFNKTILKNNHVYMSTIKHQIMINVIIFPQKNI